MKIGILIKKPENIFSNGCVQQTLFLKKVFENIGHDTVFLSLENHYLNFELSNDPVVFTNDTFDFSSFNCVILGSLVLLPDQNSTYIENLKSYNIPVINLICGNLFILHQEEFVFGHHNIITNTQQDYFTENWILEMYDYSREYIELISNKPSLVTPYVWDIDIINEYVRKNNLSFDDTYRDETKVNLVMFEPNMSIHKSSLIPLLICERYYRRHKDNLHKVYLFCGSNILSQNTPFLSNLSIVKDGKLEVYGRIIMPYIMNVIKNNNPYRSVVVSHNLLNPLNFIHLEMFFLGIPIIHNCKPFEQNKLYYGDFTYTIAVDLIEKVRNEFDSQRYKEDCTHIIQRYSPSNPEICSSYNKFLHKLIRPTKFYQGTGYVYISQGTNISSVIDMLGKQNTRMNIEIFTSRHDIPSHNNYQLLNIKFIITSNLSKTSCVESSSFKHVHFIPHNITSMSDIEIYTN